MTPAGRDPRVSRPGAAMKAPLVIKLGGRALEGPGARHELATAIAALEEPAVVVHGGGAEVSDWCLRLGLTPRFLDGLRVTDPPTLEVAVAVLAGLANKRLVAALRAAGVDAVGLSAIDGGIAAAELHPEAERLGEVGRVRAVAPALLETLLGRGHLPVLASIAAVAGRLLNVNADDFAGSPARRWRGSRAPSSRTRSRTRRSRVACAPSSKPRGRRWRRGSRASTSRRGRGPARCAPCSRTTTRRPPAPRSRTAPSRSRPMADDRGVAVLASPAPAALAAGASALAAEEPGLLAPVYALPRLELTSGQGAWVVDAGGREYLDFVSGIAVNALGVAPPGLARAVARQMKQLVHCSNLFANRPAIELAQALAAATGPPPNVVPWSPGARPAATSALISTAPSGRPPPSALASTVMSARTP